MDLLNMTSITDVIMTIHLEQRGKENLSNHNIKMNNFEYNYYFSFAYMTYQL